MEKKPEICWSLMHPTAPDIQYMKKIVQEANASPWKVDSFEMCALCHTPLGGLNGLAHFRKYPTLKMDHAAIDKNIATMREILKLAHDSGRPLYYWHREVTVPAGITEIMPDLLDEKGEFNLLGDAFEELLRCKISEAYESLPELDGIVLTLTEADYSAIHNSTPDVYPPVQVVRKVTGIFYDELMKRGKRLILRSFGSIAKDYEDILAGAKLASDDGMRFEVETKITPYDFDPFLPENPFLYHTGELTLGAECDCLGEYLGAGNFPAENVENIVRWVRGAQKNGVDRYAIRMDRVGNNVFDKYSVNIYTYMRAIHDTAATPETIYRDYAAANYPESCREELIALGKQGLQAVLKANYVQGNVIFHQTPPNASFKYFKAGGYFSNFKENVPLKYNSGMWGMLYWTSTKTRKELLEEKEEALRLTRDGIAKVEGLKSRISEKDYLRLKQLWSNLLCGASSIAAFCRCTAAYFDDMEAKDPNHTKLTSALSEAEKVFDAFTDSAAGREKFVNGLEHSLFNVRTDIREIYPAPLRTLCRMLPEEYDAEFAARNEKILDKAEDVIIPGAITDEWRCERYMHACHAILENGRPCRIIGNQVFPNGTLTIVMHPTTNGQHALLLKGEGEISVTVNEGKAEALVLNGTKVFPLPEDKEYTLKFAWHGGKEFPKLFAAAIVKA